MNTPKTGCKVAEVEPLSQPLINPAELPQSFTTTTTAADILGVRSFTAYQACYNYKKKLVIEKSPILNLFHLWAQTENEVHHSTMLCSTTGTDSRIQDHDNPDSRYPLPYASLTGKGRSSHH